MTSRSRRLARWWRNAFRTKDAAAQAVSVFISYARVPDEPFARDLHEALSATGFQVWWDRKAMESRGMSFLQEIRDAIAEVDRMVLVVGPQSQASDYVRAEWQWAREYGKPVTPVLRSGDARTMPDELRHLDAVDFRQEQSFDDALEQLTRRLTARAARFGPEDAVHPLPVPFQRRPEVFHAIRDSLLADLRRPVPVTASGRRVAIHGMSGVGKSVIATQIAMDPDIRIAFPDGVFWVDFSNQPGAFADALRRDLIVSRQTQVVRRLTESHDIAIGDVEQGRSYLSAALADRACLLILDNVWSAEEIAAFDVMGPRCRALVTTQDAGVVSATGAVLHQLDVLTATESIQLLENAAGQPLLAVTEAHAVAQECGGLPLALVVAGSLVKEGVGWADLVQKLRQANLEFLQHPKGNVFKSLSVSMAWLEPQSADRYLELAVFPRVPVPEATVAMLWKSAEFDEADARRLLATLGRRSLVRFEGDAPNRRLLLHELQHDFIRHRRPDTTGSHARLIEAYGSRSPDGWPSGPDDGYFTEQLIGHLIGAGRGAEVHDLIDNRRWLQRHAALNPTLSTFSRDVDLAVNLAERADPVDVARVASHTLLLARATERIARVPLDVPEALTRVGEWKSALMYVASITKPEQRLLASRQMLQVEDLEGDARQEIARSALGFACSVHPVLTDEIRGPIPEFDVLIKRLRSKNADDPTTTTAELGASYLTHDFFAGMRTIDRPFVLLSSRARSAHLADWGVAFKNTLPEMLTGIDFPRRTDTAPTPKEIERLRLIGLLLPSRKAPPVDLDMVRGLAAEMLIALGAPERALALASAASNPMNRFPAIAAAARAFGQQGQAERVEALWGLFDELDTSRYAGARAERCVLMLQFVEAFHRLGRSEDAKDPMGKALIFDAGLGEILDETTDIYAHLKERRRREAREGLAASFTGDRAVDQIVEKAELLTAMLRFFPEPREPRLAFAAKLRATVDEATATTWKSSPAEFARDHAIALALAGTAAWLVDDRAAAAASWRAARDAALTIDRNTDRAAVFAALANAHARAGDRHAAAELVGQLPPLLDTAQSNVTSRDRFIRQWIAASIREGKLDAASQLLRRLDSAEWRFIERAAVALALARAGDSERSREEVQALELPATVSSELAAAGARVVVALAAIDDAEGAERWERSTLEGITADATEPDRLDSLIAFVETLVEEGAIARASELSRSIADTERKGVASAAFLNALARQPGDDATLTDAMRWVTAIVMSHMNQESYHYPLAVLLCEQPIRLGRALEPEAAAVGASTFADEYFNAANTALLGLIQRDSQAGFFRALNVFRLAARRPDVPVDVLDLLEQPASAMWELFQRAANTSAKGPARTPAGFVADLRRARGSLDVWRIIEEAPAIFPADVAASIFTRVEHVESLFPIA